MPLPKISIVEAVRHLQLCLKITIFVHYMKFWEISSKFDIHSKTAQLKFESKNKLTHA